jgi:hypothetical protein
MHGTLEGSASRRPCATDRHGTYTCVVKDARSTHRIHWNPRHSAGVRLAPNARRAQGVLGTVTEVTGGSELTVGSRPVNVGR